MINESSLFARVSEIICQQNSTVLLMANKIPMLQGIKPLQNNTKALFTAISRPALEDIYK